MIKSLFPEDAQFIDRVKNRLDKQTGESCLSDFLFPWEISLIRHVALDTDYQVDEWGGVVNAFRKRAPGRLNSRSADA